MSGAKKQITFLLSVDTEEEWEWDGPFPESDFSVENLHMLPSFQAFCEEKNLRPCYFVDYAAAIGMQQQTAFLERAYKGKCELGAHLHPWANPPFFGKATEESSHVLNLPLSQVEEKLDVLLDVFSSKLAYAPKAFRTGRWGISEDILYLLYLRGFDIDSSVYPFYRNDYFDCHGSPLTPYWPDTNNVLATGSQRNILEVPVTVGFNRTPFKSAAKIHDVAQKPIFNSLKSTAILWHSKMLRKIYFSPEVASSEDMITLADSAIRNGQLCLHMYFHSSNLIKNSTGFLQSDRPFELICERISAVLEHLHAQYEVNYMTPSEYKVYLKNNQQQIAQ
jgi:hypothetical protein